MDSNTLLRLRNDFAREQKRKKTTVLLWQIAVIPITIIIWDFVSGRFIGTFELPKPLSVLESLIVMLSGPEIYDHVLTTATEFGAGYLIGITLGVVTGAWAASSKFWYAILEPVVIGFHSVPNIALAPFIVVIFGFGITSKIAIAASLASFVVFMATASGLRNVEPSMHNVSRTLGASKWQTYRLVTLPAASGSILVGLRQAVPLALIGAVVGEFIAAQKGIAFVLADAAGRFDTSKVYAGVFILALLVAVIYLVVNGLLALWSRRSGISQSSGVRI